MGNFLFINESLHGDEQTCHFHERTCHFDEEEEFLFNRCVDVFANYTKICNAAELILCKKLAKCWTY